jgi:hypothetical protein
LLLLVLYKNISMDGNMTQAQVPSSSALHIVEKTMPVNQLIMIMYNSPAPMVYDHFKMVNSHIKNELVQVGQVVLLSPADSNACTFEEQQFLTVAHEVDKILSKLNTEEKKVLASRYDFLSEAANYSGLLLGLSNTSWKSHTTQVNLILRDIERSYVSSYNKTGNLNNARFFEARNMHFKRLDSALRRFAQPAIGGNIVAGDIRRNLGLSTKSIIHDWKKLGGKMNTIPNFAKNYAVVSKMSQNLNKVGYLGIALTGVNAAANIKEACTVGNEATCNETKYTETGKAAGNVVGGIGGGVIASWAVCNLVFGLPSGGTSMFWCSLVAGASGGYVGGEALGKWSEGKGKELYKVNYNIQYMTQ